MAKVVQEQKDVFKDDYDQDVTMEHLSKMKYLECCVKEGLRLYPSVPIVGRDIKRDTIIDGQHVPKGTSVLIGKQYMPYKTSCFWESTCSAQQFFLKLLNSAVKLLFIINFTIAIVPDRELTLINYFTFPYSATFITSKSSNLGQA